MVATADVGRVAAETLLESWDGVQVVEVEGPARVSPLDLAQAFGRALGRRVAARAVPRATWATLFQNQGTPWPEPRLEMLDGFNSGWIEFEGKTPRRFGRVTVDEVARELVARTNGR